MSLRAHLQWKTQVKIKLKDLWKKVVKVTSMVMEYQILRTKGPEYQILRTMMRTTTMAATTTKATTPAAAASAEEKEDEYSPVDED